MHLHAVVPLIISSGLLVTCVLVSAGLGGCPNGYGNSDVIIILEMSADLESSRSMVVWQPNCCGVLAARDIAVSFDEGNQAMLF
jgi:hypothetical protein